MNLRFIFALLTAGFFLVSCDPPFGEAMARKRESDRALIYGGATPAPTPKRKITVTSPAPKEVRLQPFLNADVSASPTPTPTPTPGKSPAVSASTPASSPANTGEAPPFASPVPGKKGFVTSPYSPDAGFIDVSGLAPGSEAKDPYTGKIFRVP